MLCKPTAYYVDEISNKKRQLFGVSRSQRATPYSASRQLVHVIQCLLYKLLGVDRGVDLQGCSKGKIAPQSSQRLSIKLLVPTNHHMPFQASHNIC